MSLIQRELLAISIGIILMTSLRMLVSRVTATKSVEDTALIKNTVLACMILMLFVVGITLVAMGYPTDASDYGLTRSAYWTILGLTFGLALLILFSRVRWKARRSSNGPLFR